LGGRDRWGLSAIASERFDYVSRYVTGRCLDVGCGRHDRFIKEFLGGQGQGIDVFAYEGLDPEQVVEDLSRFPFEDGSFETVTFIACLNHVPRPLRAAELAEAWRVLSDGGTIIVTMGNPVAEIAVHKVVELQDRWLGTRHDVDSERGMDPDEDLFLTDRTIRGLLREAGFVAVRKKRFWTQWGLNHLFVARKGRGPTGDS
jgi:SAM-dependent methyltransferase